MGLLAVQHGVDVGPAGQQQGVDARQEGLRVGCVVDDHRLPAGAHDRVEIGAGECARAGVRPLVGATEASPRNCNDYHWSKFRCRSQSVTARLKWFHSWRAVLRRWSWTSAPNASTATFDVEN